MFESIVRKQPRKKRRIVVDSEYEYVMTDEFDTVEETEESNNPVNYGTTEGRISIEDLNHDDH